VFAKFRDVVSIPVGKKHHGRRPVVDEDAIEAHPKVGAEFKAFMREGSEATMIIPCGLEG
jgi:hypothetical protein